MSHFMRGAAAAALVSAISSPAHADHAMAGGGASSAGPILTGSPETARAGSLSGSLELRFVAPDASSDTRLETLAAQGIHAHTTDGLAVETAALAYGLTGHVTLAASLPFVTRFRLREGHANPAEVEQLGTVSGFGDLALTARYQFWHSHPQRWGVALTGGIKLPTGATGRRAPDGSLLEAEHQPGTGSWDPLLGLSAYKAKGPWGVYASANYQLATRGSQDVRMGDHANISAALVRELGKAEEEMHGVMHHRHAPPWSFALETSYEYEGRQNEAGITDTDSGSKALWLSPGLRYASPHGWGGALSLGVPLWQEVGLSHPDNSWRAVLQVGAKL